MEELQLKLDKLIAIRESWMINARNEEPMNDKIRDLQNQIQEFKSNNQKP